MLLWDAPAGHAQAARITADGLFADWQALSPAYVDPSGDQVPGRVDLGRLWCANDERFLFLRLEVGPEISLQESNTITLFIDTDNNPATGTRIHNLGAELEWRFGDKAGQLVLGGSALPISHRHVGLVTAPTVTATAFEIALERQLRPVNQIPLFPADTIRMVITDRSAGGDVLPEAPGDVAYVFDATPLPPMPVPALRRDHPAHLRMLSYNVLTDGLFDRGRAPAFGRILRAIQPDLIGFQEIYNHSAGQTVAQVQAMLSAATPSPWHGARVDPDIVVVSRYPVRNTYAIAGNGAFLLDLRPAHQSDLLLLAAHLPCCEDNRGRQYEIDALMAFLRDAKTPGGAVDVAPNTPILILGDLNLVGYAQQLHTLLHGDIVNTAQFGPAFQPDWDGSSLADLMPRHVDLPMSYTWHNDDSRFGPGRLDFMIYSDSIIEPGNNYILFTPAMSADSLGAYGLQPQDVPAASDHLPVVADFVLPGHVHVDAGSEPQPSVFALAPNYPNPFHHRTSFTFVLSESAHVEARIYSLHGQLVRVLLSRRLPSGDHHIVWDGRDARGDRASSGVYLCQLSAGGAVAQRKLLLMR